MYLQIPWCRPRYCVWKGIGNSLRLSKIQEACDLLVNSLYWKDEENEDWKKSWCIDATTGPELLCSVYSPAMHFITYQDSPGRGGDRLPCFSYTYFLVLGRGGAHTAVLRAYSWFFIQGSYREMLRRQYKVIGIQLGSVVCKALLSSCNQYFSRTEFYSLGFS